MIDRDTLPKEGSEITLERELDWHFFTNVIEDHKNLLTVGETYTVSRVMVASSHTAVWLEEFPPEEVESPNDIGRPFFNLHSFSWNNKEES